MLELMLIDFSDPSLSYFLLNSSSTKAIYDAYSLQLQLCKKYVCIQRKKKRMLKNSCHVSFIDLVLFFFHTYHKSNFKLEVRHFFFIYFY